MSLTVSEVEIRRRQCADLLLSETGIRVPDHRTAVFQWELDQIGGGEPPSARDLRRQPAKLVSLARSLAVAESYFFRHPEHFQVLEEFGASRAAAERRVRVLSAGCACGEEAWSAAAVLSGVMPPGGFSVEGWDLDSERLVRARRGIYRQWSVRAGARGFEHLIRRRDGDRFEVADELRTAVEFRCVNLALDLPRFFDFDVLFLRNVAIYWQQESAQRVLDRLLERMAPDALLLLGPSDPVRPGPGWSVDRSANVPTFRKTATGSEGRTLLGQATTVSAKPRRPKPTRVKPRRTNPRAGFAETRAARSTRSDRTRGMEKSGPSASVIHDGVNPIDDALDGAWALADQGRYGAALALIEGEDEPSARADKLRGVLSFHLERIDEALRLLRRAVFLAPDDGDARRWLSVVWRQAGHDDHAARERRNADQIDEARAGGRTAMTGGSR